MAFDPICPLCQNSDTYYFADVKTKECRHYHRCKKCDLIFIDPAQVLKPDEEKERYTMHRNDVKSPGYVAFLKTLLDPVLHRCLPSSRGLDFGAGPYPMMAEVAKDMGYQLEIYDPFFAPNDHLLSEQFDFVLSCEVVEHFTNPLNSFEQMIRLVKAGGLLGIKTGIFDDQSDFSNWHYVKDETHISIYTERTLLWISRHWNLAIEYLTQREVIYRKIKEP